MNPTIKARIENIRRGEVPQGYKRTKIGIVPKEWSIEKLGNYLIQYKEVSLYNNQYPVLTSSRRGIFLQADYYKKEVASEDNTGYNVVPKGYFTYRHMSDDNIFKFNINTIVDKGIVSTLYPVFTTHDICNDYLLVLLNEGKEFQRFACMQKQGGSRTYIYFEKLKRLNVCLPMISEQEKIAEILAGQDRVIELKEKLLAEKQKQKKYLMQQLLTGKKRLPGFSGDWKKVLLGDLVQISTGNKNTQDQVVNGKYPFFIRSDEVCRINSYSYDGEAILIPGEGKIGEIFHYINGKFDYHQRVYKISDFSCNGKYIFYYLQAFFKKRALSMSAKATVDSLRREMLTGMEINLPSVKEQSAIAGILSTADKEIELLQKDIEQEKLKKKSLMQLLLTGIVRVDELVS